MAYLSNIPLSSDALSVSQGNLLGNFQFLGAIAGISGTPVTNAINSTGGFNWVYLTVQATTPPPGSGFIAGTVSLYSALNNTGSYATGRNELYLQKKNPTAAGDIQIPATAFNQIGANTGWTYLPSGIILQWDQKTSLPYGNNPITFPVTFPSACYGVIVCTQGTSGVGGDSNTFIRLNSYTTSGFTCFASQRTALGAPSGALNAGLNYIAIGI